MVPAGGSNLPVDCYIRKELKIDLQKPGHYSGMHRIGGTAGPLREVAELAECRQDHGFMITSLISSAG
jgi:hypothetical protein